MDDRTRTLLLFSVLGVTFCAAGCGVTAQPTRFQMSFLPSAPPSAAATPDLPAAPAPKPNIYLRDMPAFLLANPQLPPRQTRGDALILQANERFQRGKRYYQAKDAVAARQEFNAAIDLMLEASDHSPADRLEYERRLEELAETIHRFDLADLGASDDLAEGKFEKAPLEDLLEMTFPVDPNSKDRIREQVSATVSQLPLSLNDMVLGYINYFSNRGFQTIVAGMKRSGRYRPMIQRILDEEGVPQELIHLAQAESGFIPRAMSRKAAGGMWQFVKFRGNEYGLTQTKHTDERMDPEKATRAAARHLRDLYNQFGDWYLAIAAYNCGPGVVDRAVERTGYADFWELRRRAVLPAETTNYVPIILAMTIMEKNAAAYGLEGIQLDPPLEYDTVAMASPTSMALLSDITETGMAELAVLNPAVLKTMVPEKFEVHVPKGTGNLLVSTLQAVPAEHRDSWRMHRVGTGETLATIGKRYGANPSSIISANNLAAAEPVEGDRLLIPAAARPEAPPVRVTARKSPARASSASQRTSRKATSTKPASASRAKKAKPAVIVARANGR